MKAFRFDNSYLRLPERFYSRVSPVPVSSPRIVVYNSKLAESLGIEDPPAEVLAGNLLASGSDPIAQAYAGHQYGNFVVLGDGRAHLLGEHLTPEGKRFDIQLKGSGQTPYSRRGDGRAALSPMLREYIISEAMWGLGIPTTRSLAVVETGDAVYRDGDPQKGGVLVRIASSHIRVGTFEYFAARQDIEAIRLLADYTIERHYPEIEEEPYLSLLRAVAERQARLVASWMHVGFVHGVLNTDNVALSGETIDFGPCAFIDAFDPDAVFSSIDHYGRYSYGNQPNIAQWNIARLAESLLPLLHPDEEQAIKLAEQEIERFGEMFKDYWLVGMRNKLGLLSAEADDISLIEEFLLGIQGEDFTNSFCELTDGTFKVPSLTEWLSQYKKRINPYPKVEVSQLMQKSNPRYIPRNHIVEEALQAAVAEDNYTPLERLVQIVKAPFEAVVGADRYTKPGFGTTKYLTYCGT